MSDEPVTWTGIPRGAPLRDAQESLVAGQPRYFGVSDTITFTVPYPPFPCVVCGTDLRGKDAVFVNPRVGSEPDTTAFDVACPGCAGDLPQLTLIGRRFREAPTHHDGGIG